MWNWLSRSGREQSGSPELFEEKTPLSQLQARNFGRSSSGLFHRRLSLKTVNLLVLCLLPSKVTWWLSCLACLAPVESCNRDDIGLGAHTAALLPDRSPAGERNELFAHRRYSRYNRLIFKERGLDTRSRENSTGLRNRQVLDKPSCWSWCIIIDTLLPLYDPSRFHAMC